MSKLDDIERQAKDAVRSLRGSMPLQAITAYIDALAADTARRAMKAPGVAEMRQKQGEHAALTRLADLLRSEATTVAKRTTLRNV